jgi:putative membrane protein
MMKRLRTLVFALVAVLVIIVVLQNTQSVETRILLVTLSMPRAVLLFVTLLLGFVLGLVAASWRGREGGSRTDS